MRGTSEERSRSRSDELYGEEGGGVRVGVAAGGRLERELCLGQGSGGAVRCQVGERVVVGCSNVLGECGWDVGGRGECRRTEVDRV